MKKIIGLALIVLGIVLEIMWLGVCFGSIIIGVLLLFFAPRILFFPFNFFLIIGLSLFANRTFEEYKYQRKTSFNYETFKQSNKIDAYYEILESKKEDDFETIKKNYRRLMRKYHYDSNASKGLSEKTIKEHQEKTQKMNEAYGYIKADRA
jgi:hypothetical protein